MKGIATLIKLHKRSLDELRRSMVGLENQKAQLQRSARKLVDELAREMDLAGKHHDMMQFFGDFAKRIRNRQQEIAKEISALDVQIDKLALRITEAFAELKKYEIARDNFKKRAAEKARRKETIELDDIAGQQHQRKKEQ